MSVMGVVTCGTCLHVCKNTYSYVDSCCLEIESDGGEGMEESEE